MADEMRPVWRNWSGEQRCEPARIERPRTREGLVTAIVAAREEGRRVRVAGSGHSFTGAALTDGVMIAVEGLDRILDFDPGTGRVRVEAGIVLGRLTRRLARMEVAFENLGDIDRQTLAGSISTGTHGTGERFRSLSAQVAGIELITADGETVELDARSDPTGLEAARVAIGSLGVIYAVTVETVPSYRIDRTDRPRPLAETLDSLDEHVAAHDHFELYVFPHTDVALCRESRRTGEPAEPPHPVARYAREVMVENWLAAAFAAANRRLPKATPFLARRAAAGVGRSRRLDHSYRVFASERRVRFTELEYSVPRRHAREAIGRVLEVAARPELQVGFPIEVRFVAADGALLSPSHDRDSCYIACHQDRRLDWRSYFAAVERALEPLEGRPHWGKRHSLSHRELAPRYPRWRDFQRVRRRLDPDGAFANPYTDRVLGPVS